MTINAASNGQKAEAVRVFIDLRKLKEFPLIKIWYANSPAFDKATMKDALQEEIFRAGRAILSYERVRVSVPSKPKWKSVACPCCGDPVPDYLLEHDQCGGCGSMKYYEKILG
jgi:formylmethanofuran dehydrogenase subunit E